MLLQERLSNIEQLKYQVAKIKTTIDIYLANTDEPLDERWSLYQALPSFLRNHVCCVQDFLVQSNGSFVELCQISDHLARHEHITVHDFLDDWKAAMIKHKIDITATKEYILSKNLGSFENDW